MTKIHQLTQNWFEMLDIRQRSFNNCVWIPLRANICHEKQGQYGFLNYKEDYVSPKKLSYLSREFLFIACRKATKLDKFSHFFSFPS